MVTMDEKKKLGGGTLAILQIVAGGSAGFVEVCLMHPLDLIKTRLQIQRGHDDPQRYSSMLDCVRKMIKHEGALSFYKGILPPIVAETPKRATKFFTFEQYKKIFSFGSKEPTFWALTMAGLGSGITESFISNPFEVVKIQLQADRGKFAQTQTSYAKARQIIKRDGWGLRGINRGLTAIMARNGTFNCVYFSFYYNLKPFIPKTQDARKDLGYRLLLGFTAGTLASCVNIPFDVAKSRIQGPQPPHQTYYGTLNTIALVYKQEGFTALYKGLVPKIMRLGPGGAIMLVVFESVYEKLQHFFLKHS